MDFSDISSIILNGLIARAPFLAAWIAATTIAAIMLRHGGGRAERFLLAGSCVMFAKQLFYIPVSAVIELLIVPSMIERGVSRPIAVQVFSYNSIFFGLVGLAGIICLVYAFWTKFKVKS